MKKKGLWHKRIPNLAALGLLLFGLWVTTLLIQTGVIFVGRAGPNNVPQNVSITNITDTSFTVNFTTNETTLTGLKIQEGNSSESFLVYDDRNKTTNQQTKFLSHYITVSDLKPNTTYSFSILADGEEYLDNGKNYNLTTGVPIVGAPPAQNPIVGKILLPDGSPGRDVLVELTISGAQKISVLTKEDGQYIIPTNSIRDSSLKDYIELTGDQEVTITAKRQNTKSTVVSLFASSANIPVITLDQTYDFTNVTKDETATLSSQLQIPTPRIGIGEVRITTPRENQTFVDARPLFRGTATARQTVKLNYDNFGGETTTDGNGVWTFRPENDIPAGEHTLTIQSVDRFGITKSVSQSFTIFASGSQVAQTATPSATPTTTPTATPTIAPSPTLTPTSVPSPTVIATPTNTPIATISPTPVLDEKPTATPTATLTPTLGATATLTLAPSPTTAIPVSPPAPGSGSAIALTVISIILIFAGGTLLFLL